MLPSLVRLSVNRTSVPADGIPPEIWRNVLATVIDDDLRYWVGADPQRGRDNIRGYAEDLDSEFSRICEMNNEFRNLCANDPSIWAVLVTRERDVMIDKLTELQAQQSIRKLPRYRFEAIEDFVQLFLKVTKSNLNTISPTLGRTEAMRLLVLMFGAPKWYLDFMWVLKDEEGDPSDD